MQRIQDMLGREHNSDTVNRALRDFVRSRRPSIVGAVQVSCSDETEREIVESFQHWFAEPLLPELKFWNRSVFRSANLGGRYEWGAIRIADEHYDNPEMRDGRRVLLVKLNSHVAVNQVNGERIFGRLDRYSRQSPCCGAIDALLAGVRHPAMDEIRTMFQYDGCDRMGALLDATVVPEKLRSFVAAVVNARLQARSAIVDIQSYQADIPTLFVVVPCVTLNLSQRDTEFVVGVYWADSAEDQANANYLGLGDDPACYEVIQQPRLTIADDQLKQPRAARDHRQDVVDQWRARRETIPQLDDPRVHQIEKQLDAAGATPAVNMTQEAFKTLLWIAADVAPVPLSIMLFAKGLAGIHHLYQVHRLARGTADAEAARKIIAEVADQSRNYSADQTMSAIRAILQHAKGHQADPARQ